jgi:hypothetical protein
MPRGQSARSPASRPFSSITLEGSRSRRLLADREGQEAETGLARLRTRMSPINAAEEDIRRPTGGRLDAPCVGGPVRVLWRKRTWTCLEPAWMSLKWANPPQRLRGTASTTVA